MTTTSYHLLWMVFGINVKLNITSHILWWCTRIASALCTRKKDVRTIHHVLIADYLLITFTNILALSTSNEMTIIRLLAKTTLDTCETEKCWKLLWGKLTARHQEHLRFNRLAALAAIMPQSSQKKEST